MSSKRDLTGDELSVQVRAHLDSPDVQNVMDTMGAGVTSRSAVEDGILQGATTEGEDLERFGWSIIHQDGVEQSAVIAHLPRENRLLISQRYSIPVEGTGTVAQVFSLHPATGEGVEDTIIRTEAQSFNGAPPRPIPADADLTLQQDPCGGCNGICQVGGEELRSSCNFEASLSCILGAGGCAFCIGCSPTILCIGCVVTSCAAAVIACCPGNNPACRRCQRVC